MLTYVEGCLGLGKLLPRHERATTIVVNVCTVGELLANAVEQADCFVGLAVVDHGDGAVDDRRLQIP